MEGRKYSAANSYRYGFNGQEKSDEIKGESNSYTAEFWEYDPRIGRRNNLDPVPRANSDRYVVLGNNPLIFIDPNGADWYYNKKTKETTWFDGKGKQKGYKHLGATYTGWTNDGKAYINYGSKGKDDITVVNRNEMENIVVSTTVKSKNSGGCTCWFHSLSFTTSGSGKVTFGPQIGYQTKIGGVVNLNVKAGGNFEVISGTAGYNPNGNEGWLAEGNYVGKNGTFVTQQYFNVELTTNKGIFGKEYGLGARYKENGISYSNGKFVSTSSSQVTIGVPLLKSDRAQNALNRAFQQQGTSNQFYTPNLSAPALNANANIPVKDKFAGLDLEFGAALGIGFEIQFKLGFNY